MTYLKTTDVAKLVRKAVQEAFPKTRFSVRSKSYSGGSSIDVEWTDGPTVAQVQPILDRFSGSGFDGMQDLKYSLAPIIVNGERVDLGVDFVFGHRSESFQALREAALRVAFECELPLLHINEAHGYIDGPDKDQRVPYCYFIDSDVLAHDSHEGEWYEQLVYRVARACSYEDARTVDLPERVAGGAR